MMKYKAVIPVTICSMFKNPVNPESIGSSNCHLSSFCGNRARTEYETVDNYEFVFFIMEQQ